MRRPALVRTLALTAALTPGAALACGGFFRGETVVDQSAERIIFKQHADGGLETLFDIRYQGDPRSFAWVIPVTGVAEESKPGDQPDLSVFELIDSVTAPVIQAACVVSEAGGSIDAGAPGEPPGLDPDLAANESSRVQVLDRRVVGAYDIVTLDATDADALTKWLREREFRITDEMVPFLKLYLGKGLKFMAIKLVADAGLEGIKPLRLRYAAGTPLVPLRLASLAAVPEMGLTVIHLGEGRITPANTAELPVDLDQLAWDSHSETSNWSTLVARAIDANRGEGMVVDYAGDAEPIRSDAANENLGRFVAGEDTAKARQFVADLLDGVKYVTRLSGRYAPEEMGIDLTFKAAPTLDDVARERQQPREELCYSDRRSCDFMACGQGGLCVLTTDANGENVPACACVDGAAARAVADDDVPGGVRVSCVDVRMNVDPIDATKPLDPTLPDLPPLDNPCSDDPCGGHGECFALNGAQTCLCERGFVAVAQQKGDTLVATCQAPSEDVPDDFYRRQLPEPRLPFPGMGGAPQSLSDEGCAQTPAPSSRSAWWMLLGGLPLLLRRMRKRG
jgi:hypothetical protein